jgi:SAM-dependent methyltransferase
MTDPALQAQIDAATAHEDLFVPALFREWAPRVVAAAQLQPGQRVIDVACGTGVLAREAASCVGAAGSVVGLDANVGMLMVARRLAPGVEWREGMGEVLPYPDRSFKAVVSQFGLIFFADRREAVCEVLRVLAPGGRPAVAVWNCLDNTPGYAAEVALLERIAGRLGDRKELVRLFASGGLAAVGITMHHGTAKFPSLRSMVEGDLRGWLPVMGVALVEDQIKRMIEEAEHALSAFVTTERTVEFDAPAHIVTATGH